MNSSDTTTLGQRLRATRLARGLTIEALARQAGLALNTVFHAEHDYVRQPQQRTLLALARVLQVSPEWLATGAGDPAA